MCKRRLVEGLKNDFELLFEQLAIGIRVEHRRIERLDLTRVVAAANAKEHSAASQIVSRGVVLGQSQRMPHRQDVEATAELDPLGEMGEMNRQEKNIWYDLIPFTLEVVFG